MLTALNNFIYTVRKYKCGYIDTLFPLVYHHPVQRPAAISVYYNNFKVLKYVFGAISILYLLLHLHWLKSHIKTKVLEKKWVPALFKQPKTKFHNILAK